MIHWLSGTPPSPPYYATIFSSIKHSPRPGYEAMDDATMQAAERTPGYLGHQSVQNGDHGIFISYWKDEQAIDAWRNDRLHNVAKARGKADWFDRYSIQICKVEHAVEHQRPEPAGTTSQHPIIDP